MSTVRNPRSSADNQGISIEDLAALARKIGEEIWGKEQFAVLMNAADGSETTTAAPGTGEPVPSQPSK